MSVKPVTYQGVFNFNANLYALEVKSRFIDQSKANGYYKGYGEELAATVVGTQIKIGTGAFVVQGRMNEITAAEMVSPQMFDGFVGYVIARIETYHPSDEKIARSRRSSTARLRQSPSRKRTHTPPRRTTPTRFTSCRCTRLRSSATP